MTSILTSVMTAMFNVIKRIFRIDKQFAIVSDPVNMSAKFAFAQLEQCVTNFGPKMEEADTVHPVITGILTNIVEHRQISLQILDSSSDVALTVKLADNQDAVVYYQHTKTEQSCASNIDFVFPRSPQKIVNSKEYQLSYDKHRQYCANTDSCADKLHVVVYQKNSQKIYNVENVLKGIDTCRYELLRFNTHENQFEEVSLAKIDFSVKTLILVHGTFSNTRHSFRDIVGDKSDWLKQLIDKGIYRQILGFDHPTLIADARVNVEMLYRMLGSSAFVHPTDFIGTSQGGLLCQYIANDRREVTPFSTGGVGKVVLVNSANGVGYLTTAKGIEQYFNVLRWANIIEDKLFDSKISRIANLSIEMLTQLPGLDLMTPGSDRLLEILDHEPAGKNTRYLPIISDFDPKSAKKKLKIRLAQWLDRIIKNMLGNDNDWVVGTKEQYRVPKEYCAIQGYDPDNYSGNMVSAIHGKSLALPTVREDIERFMR